MAKKLVLALLKQFRVSSRKLKNKGMTLTELLVSMIIAGIIIPVLLSFVVDLVQTNQQEFAQNETQREMQMALDFIAADLREAVYVYNNGELNGGPEPPGVKTRQGTPPPLINYLPADWPGKGYVPILAFWKPEPIPDEQIPDRGNCPTGNRECELLQLKRRAYSLVVYLQKTGDNPPLPNSPWRGKARILRYQLVKYQSPLTTAFTQNVGYVDPVVDQPDGRKTDFQNWPLNVGAGGAGSLQAARPIDRAVVLVDFLDAPTRPTDVQPASLNCPAATAADPGYSRIPPESANITNFFVCVKRLSVDLPIANQDAIVFIRGNAGPRIGQQNSNKSLLTLRTQVIARGVEDKPQQ